MNKKENTEARKQFHYLLTFSAVIEPVAIVFCSSICTALDVSYATIQQKPVYLNSALMGDGQSKLAGERIVGFARQ